MFNWFSHDRWWWCIDRNTQVFGISLKILESINIWALIDYCTVHVYVVKLFCDHVVFLSGRESVQVFFFFIYQIVIGDPVISIQYNPATLFMPVPSQDLDFQCRMSLSFFVFSLDERWLIVSLILVKWLTITV